MLFDALKLSEAMEKIVVKGTMRRYYRVVRGGRWYGGIATSDCCGCNLKCVFCWSGAPRDNPSKTGKLCAPEQIYNALRSCALKRGYYKMRISGNEPTIGRGHLTSILELVEEDGRFEFILETNGILIGNDKSYARDLSKFSRLHVRVSLKGTSEEEFSLLTGALPEQFDLQLRALENLLDFGVSCHPAVMLSFSDEEGIKALCKRTAEIDPKLEIEEEHVFMYPHAEERLKNKGLNPKTAYRPNSIPEELI